MKYGDIVAERTINEANYLCDKNTTIREVAKEFGVCKSTVFFDLRFRLPTLDAGLYDRVKEVLDRNTRERYSRGGLSTREKYKNKTSRLENYCG